MKEKLKIFSDFARGLLPLEVEYLMCSEKFEDPINRDILSRISHYNRTGKLTLPGEIDKRKYSYVKGWITRKLGSIDVDASLMELCDLDRKIMTDTLLPDDEKKLAGMVKNQASLPFYFMRLYELIKEYQSFLLIRVRHQYVEVISRYLQEFEAAYLRSKEIRERLNEATRDIVKQYSFYTAGAQRWEGLLKEVFYDDTLDGLNRYNAIVRLTFLYYNDNRLDQIQSLYDYLDTAIVKGNFYSRRILLNYYSNRVILHAKMGQLERAEHYGLLSVREKGADYIQYLNNLCSVLLKRHKNRLALELMQRSFPELKKTMSYHSRVGFAALFIRCLNADNRPAEGQSYASTFFKAYKEKIMLYRWHSFFSAYLQSLIMQEKYSEVLTICHRQKIMDLELDYLARAAYLPTISWYYHISLYKTGKTDLKTLKAYMASSEKRFSKNPGILDLKTEIVQHLPELSR